MIMMLNWFIQNRSQSLTLRKDFKLGPMEIYKFKKTMKITLSTWSLVTLSHSGERRFADINYLWTPISKSYVRVCGGAYHRSHSSSIDAMVLQALSELDDVAAEGGDRERCRSERCLHRLLRDLFL